MTNRRQHIDLNADLGEGAATDEALLDIVSSCNVACGGHAGDEASMASTVTAAAAAGVAVGAHPSYPDREGFGRRSAYIDAAALCPHVERQVADLRRIAAAAGVAVGHVKPHGALYNDAAKDAALADAVCSVIRSLDPGMWLVGPPDSELERAAHRSGLAFLGEGFVDRAYQADGALVPRSEPGAVYDDPEQAARQAADIATLGTVMPIDGDSIALQVGTLCIHGDTPGALESARRVREALERAGIRIAAPARH